ncbi:MAG: hypothetical protein M1147_09625 [Nitrospirae bacterium]|nr:hypothetical protein [Nitrospirota bacterium]MCL5978355.1 hypothetical protein [Nitrospirota bacterium]
MKKIICLIVLSFIVIGCVPPSERKNSNIQNQKPDDKTLYDYAVSQFMKHMNEKHNCTDIIIIDQKLVTRDDMIISEKWTADQCGRITEHIVIRGSDQYGEMVVGVGELDGSNKKEK